MLFVSFTRCPASINVVADVVSNGFQKVVVLVAILTDSSCTDIGKFQSALVVNSVGSGSDLA